MKKGAKIGIILGIGAIVAAIAYYFLVHKPKKDAEKADLNNGNNGTTGNNNNVLTNPALGGASSIEGKNAYAKVDGVIVQYASDGKTVKVVNKDKYVGIVEGTKTVAAKKYYTLNNGTWLVYANAVYLK